MVIDQELQNKFGEEMKTVMEKDKILLGFIYLVT